jgi:flavodoxin
MKTLVISYSLTGNNEALATSLAEALGSEHVRITERKSRTMGTIVTDVIFKRSPKIEMPTNGLEDYDMVLFVGPVWMGQIAAPFRRCFKALGPSIGDYGYVTICGGAEGPNPKLADELEERLGKAPVCLIDMHLADFLPPEPKPTRQDTMAYRINEREVRDLTKTVVATLHDMIGG